MFLNKIIDYILQEIKDKKRLVPVDELQMAALKQPMPLDFSRALQGNRIKLIAEVKKASPSRGTIRHDFNPVELAQIYAGNGASAVSVLTEVKHFQGSLNHLEDIRKALGKKLPLLRKDFIVDPYNIYESRAYGADALLLIVAILTPQKLSELLRLSHEQGMCCLVEAHNEAEIEIAVDCGAKVIGINNRDLTTFNVDLDTTRRLRPLVPPDRVVVSESGIKNRSDMEQLKEWGVDAVLIGEALVSAPNVAVRMKELL